MRGGWRWRGQRERGEERRGLRCDWGIDVVGGGDWEDLDPPRE
jgi:hypothetical protein